MSTAEAAPEQATLRTSDIPERLPYDWASWSCVDERPGSVSATIDGPSSAQVAPAGGEVSWAFTPAAGSAELFGLKFQTTGGWYDVDGVAVDVYGAGAESGKAVLLAHQADGTTYVGTSTAGGVEDAWSTVTLRDRLFHWTHVDAGYDPIPGYDGHGQVEDLVMVPGVDTRSWTGLIGFGCDGDPFLLDRFHYGDTGYGVLVDLERYEVPPILDAPARAVITAGETLTLSARTGALGLASLQEQRLGDTRFRTVRTGLSAPAGAASLSVRVAPQTSTSYRLRETAQDCCEATTSGLVSIKVRTAVTARIADRTLERGQRLVVSGRVRPAKPGATVTLRRSTSTGSIKLADARVRSDGTYRVAHTVRSGTWRVFTTIPAVSGNLAGKSVVRRARVG